MSNDPYTAGISRIFGIVAAGLGSAACLFAVAGSLLSGNALGFGRRTSALGSGYTAAADPSQFWFGILSYLMVGLALGWVALRSYRS